MKRIGALLLLLVGLIGFTGCQKDEELFSGIYYSERSHVYAIFKESGDVYYNLTPSRVKEYMLPEGDQIVKEALYKIDAKGALQFFPMGDSTITMYFQYAKKKLIIKSGFPGDEVTYTLKRVEEE